MTSRDFVYWLQGLFELGNPESLNARQTKLIKQHLAMVFVHEIDPSMGDEKHQGKLNSIHNGEMSSIVNTGINVSTGELGSSIEISPQQQSTTVKPYMLMSEEELDELYGKGVRPRC